MKSLTVPSLCMKAFRMQNPMPYVIWVSLEVAILLSTAKVTIPIWSWRIPLLEISQYIWYSLMSICRMSIVERSVRRLLPSGKVISFLITFDARIFDTHSRVTLLCVTHSFKVYVHCCLAVWAVVYAQMMCLPKMICTSHYCKQLCLQSCRFCSQQLKREIVSS